MTDKPKLPGDMWQIRNVPKETRTKIKRFAFDNGQISIAEALTLIAKKYLK